MTDPNTPEGFPDLFIYTLKTIIETEVGADPDFAASLVTTRAVRPDDPSRTIAVIEGEAEPRDYEIAGQMAPSIMEWSAVVQVMVKHSNEIEGRNIRKRLLQRVRKALFLPSSVQALMTLNDATIPERVSKFRLRRIDFASAEARDSTKQFFFLGQIELLFQTEHL